MLDAKRSEGEGVELVYQGIINAWDSADAEVYAVRTQWS
jgi:hypothetical protein